MEIKKDHLTGAVFKVSLTVLGWTRMNGSRRMYAIKCSICASDPQLYGEAIFETGRDSLLKGYKPCGCGQAYRPSRDQYELMIRRKASELDVEFIGWVDGFKNGSSKILMSCDKGTWTPRAHFFIKKGHISFNRGLARTDDSVIIAKFFATGAFHEDTKFSRYRLYDKWYWKVECPVCNGVGYSQPQHLQRGSRCCECGNYKQRFSYLTLIKDKELPIAVKFGITRTTDMRMKYQARETPYDLESLGMWEYPDKSQCVAAERFCIQNLECGVLSREEYGDGYTETTYVYNIDAIIKIYEDHGGIRL